MKKEDIVNRALKAIGKKEKPTVFTPACGRCKKVLLWSRFSNGVNRYLCGECGGVIYLNDKAQEVRGYSIYE